MVVQTESTWQRITRTSPPEGVTVWTKIDDEHGPRNVAMLKRQGSLWFHADGAMYVYYVPTHWRPETRE